MKKKNTKISINVKCQKVGVKDDYFGKIQIQNKEFDYNFSILTPLEDFKEKSLKEYLRFIKSIDFILFNGKGEEIDLNKKEFYFFISILVMSLIMTPNKLHFELHFLIEISFKKANLITNKKFGCQIEK